MKIAVIGEGNVGGTLGRRWSAAGHEVVYGVREPDGAANRLSSADAASDAEVVVFAVPAGAALEAVQAAGDLSGRIVVDCMNPIAAGFSGVSQPEGRSLAEDIQRAAPKARVVKAFNTVGFNIMADPAFPNGHASMLIAGDDAAAKNAVTALAVDLGFEAVDAGPLVQARTLEWFAWLWISMAMKYGQGRDIAFHFMRR